MVVACAVGISRSASVVLAHLMQLHGLSLATALQQLKAVKRDVDPGQNFLEDLQLFEQQLHSGRS